MIKYSIWESIAIIAKYSFQLFSISCNFLANLAETYFDGPLTGRQNPGSVPGLEEGCGNMERFMQNTQQIVGDDKVIYKIVVISALRKICCYRPRSEASEGYVFTGICLSNSRGGGRWRTRSQQLPLPPGPGDNTSLPPDQVTTPPSLPPGTR